MTDRDRLEGTDREEIGVEAGGVELEANLVVPTSPRGLVMIVGGPESDAVLGRLARDLQEARLGTVLLHRRPPAEARGEEDGHDAGRTLAVDRILAACELLERRPATARLELGLLAAGQAAESALGAAAQPGTRIRAVVSVDGQFKNRRPAEQEAVPTLLLVADEDLAPGNEAALAGVAGEKELRIVRSSHRSSEERLEGLSRFTVRWFGRYLGRS